jgi:hypothetical protein
LLFRVFYSLLYHAFSGWLNAAAIWSPIMGTVQKEGGRSMARSAISIPSAEGGLSHYLDEIRKFPMLEPQQEYMLAKRYAEHADRDAAHKLVTSHLRLVAKIAMGYRGYGLPIGEVVSEGQRRPDAGRQEVRSGTRLPFGDLCDVVDQGLDPGIHPALVVARENGHHRQPEDGCSSTCAG